MLEVLYTVEELGNRMRDFGYISQYYFGYIIARLYLAQELAVSTPEVLQPGGCFLG